MVGKNLTGKVAVVTGGLGMLGSRFANTLVRAGAKVAVIDLRDENPGVIKPKDFRNVSLYKTDITKSEGVKTVFDEITRTLGAPAVLINCAGIDSKPNAPPDQNGPFENYPEKMWDIVLDSHLKGAFLASREFLRKFRAAGLDNGSIINISSTYGLVAPDQSMYEYRHKRGENFFKPVAYSVAKAGMLGFTKALAGYCASFGVRVNALAPGGVYSGQDKEFVHEYEKRTMLGRMAKPDDFNAAILFLASDASSYMTGATLVIDGGWTAR